MSRNLFGLDYTGHLTPAQHKAVGSSFACRYLSGFSKDLGVLEAHQLRAGGIDVVVVWETTTTRWMQGELAGANDARMALDEANKRGIPSHRPIYFAVDFDETPAQTPSLHAYFTGVVSVLGVARVGVYGDFYVVNRVVEAGLAKYSWQTYAWSGGQVSKHANLLQYSNSHSVAGVGVDYNRSLKEDFGQWDYKPPAPVLKSPKGIWSFHGTWDAERDHWTIDGAPGQNVEMGQHPLRHGATISVGEQDGAWEIHRS